jgi:exodeoxyribonuclease VII large subunit
MNWDLFGGDRPPPRQPGQQSARHRIPISPASVGRAYTVSGLTALARQVLEDALPTLWVSGEVTNWKRNPNGHCYFSLRDHESQIRCVMFRAEAQRLPAYPEEGMQVKAMGTLTVFEKRGEFQFVVRELDGLRSGGLWKLAFEKLKKKLEQEGLLAAERKRPLPRFPATVGVVTSPVGAALHDVLHVIERRAPWTRVVFSPAKVQGDGAAIDIARAIGLFSRTNVADVLIVGRGGGSVEDLWAFNEEVVARAIATCPIPVISAVGHEVDITIADLVADVRAPTPSAAAERSVPDRAALLSNAADTRLRLRAGLGRRVTRARDELSELAEAVEDSMRTVLHERRERMLHAASKLEVLSPLAALRRGYALPLGSGGKLKRFAADFSKGDDVRLVVSDGEVDCTVTAVRPAEEPGNG